MLPDWGERFVHYEQVTVKDAGTRHAVTLGTDKES